MAGRHIDFGRINRAAVSALPLLLGRWQLRGRWHSHGREFVALNPTRPDRTLGSFSINRDRGIWMDFSTGDGGDLIDLHSYLRGIGKGEAARELAHMLGVPT
jgi:putative DNA primase/helicase